MFQAAERGDINIIESFDNEENACKLVLDYISNEKKPKGKKSTRYRGLVNSWRDRA